MATIITAFDPSATSSGTFDVGLTNGGWLFLHNESPATLQFSVGVNTGGFLVPAYSVRCWLAPLNSSRVTWKRLGFVANTNVQSPISTVYGEAYAPNEWTGGEGFWPLMRAVNQPRVVSVPMAAPFRAEMIFTAPTSVLPANAANIQLITGGFQFLLAVGSQTVKPKFYIHTAEAIGLTVGSCYLAVYFWYVDNTNTPIAAGFANAQALVFHFWRAGQFGPAGGSHIVAPTPNGIFGQTVPANAVGFNTYCVLGGGSPGMTVSLRMDISVDSTNTSIIGGVGSPSMLPGDMF